MGTLENRLPLQGMTFVKLRSDQFKVDEAWIVTRLDSMIQVEERPIDIYVLMDAGSAYAFGHIAFIGETPSKKEFKALFRRARKQSKRWPTKIYIPKEDPSEAIVKSLATDVGMILEPIPGPYLDLIVGPIKEGLMNFQSGPEETPSDPELAAERESARSLIPDSYDLCPCASGKKFKFCCKVIFREVAEAMCAVETGKVDEAIKWLDQAKNKVGETAEILCRYGIAYALRSEDQYIDFLSRALTVNPNHPRTHYLYGLHYRQKGLLNEAVLAYEKAIQNYPVTDKYHLNETWNNLGTVYFDLSQFDKAKGAWEKALIYLPSDKVTKDNLREFIYGNPRLSQDLRTPSPFVARYM